MIRGDASHSLQDVGADRSGGTDGRVGRRGRREVGAVEGAARLVAYALD